MAKNEENIGTLQDNYHRAYDDLGHRLNDYLETFPNSILTPSHFKELSTDLMKERIDKFPGFDSIIPFERSYWVVPGKLLAGYTPASRNKETAILKLTGLKRIGITYILDLTEQGETNYDGVELGQYENLLEDLKMDSNDALKVKHFPIKDGHIPTKEFMDTIMEILNSLISRGEKVYIHCWGGRGRTGTVVACYMLDNNMASQSNIFEMIRYLRRTDPTSLNMVPETKIQRDFVKKWKKMN